VIGGHDDRRAPTRAAGCPAAHRRTRPGHRATAARSRTHAGAEQVDFVLGADNIVVVLRKNISRMKGETVLIDEIRYFFYFTTYSADTHAPAQIVALANGPCDQENIVGRLKSGINALHAPVDDLHSNWAYMLIAALAWNIKALVDIFGDKVPCPAMRSSAMARCQPAEVAKSWNRSVDMRP
jgi:hypothetical protein